MSERESNVSVAIEERKRETNRENKLRAERVPVFEQDNLTITKEPGYAYRLVNDSYGRIDRFLRAGWTLVEDNINTTCSIKGKQLEAQKNSQAWRVVNQSTSAPCRDGVYMRIPQELFDEDQAKKLEKVNMAERAIDPDGVIRQAQMKGPLFNKAILKTR